MDDLVSHPWLTARVKELIEQADDLVNDSGRALGVKTRTKNCLTNANIVYLAQLIVYSEQELAKLTNLGDKSYEFIYERILKPRDLKLSSQFENFEVLALACSTGAFGEDNQEVMRSAEAFLADLQQAEKVRLAAGVKPDEPYVLVSQSTASKKTKTEEYALTVRDLLVIRRGGSIIDNTPRNRLKTRRQSYHMPQIK
jgi:hypothetical protein